MNLIDVMKDQLSGDVTNKLGSLIGGTESQTKLALSAAIPALLSAFSGMASTGGSGAEKLASAVNQFGAGSTGQAANMLSTDPEQAAQQGNNLLGSLLGGGTLSALTGTLARFLNLDSGIINKLLAYAAPLVMGAIAKQFHGKPATAQGLSNMFAQQKENIADAMPAHLSLADIPNLDMASAARGVTSAAQRTAGAAKDASPSLLKTLIPVAALALIGLLGWQYYKNQAPAPIPAIEQASPPVQRTALKPVTDLPDAVPDAAKVSNDLTMFFKNATQTLSGVTDAASAQAALPKLNELNTQIDGLAALREKLPASVRSSAAKIATDNFGKLNELIQKVLAIPGVKAVLGPVLDGLIPKLKAFEDNK